MISTTFKDKFDQFAQNISINGSRDSISYESFLALLSEIDKQVAEERKEFLLELNEIIRLIDNQQWPFEITGYIDSLISKYSEEK